ncbi:hypothetical protein GIB67_030090 [Kingdonia uniflora]|uniref:Hexosyltransferase n=1 Tax=Kingdonia uniflora TaxID=39325 RepID=A0A7J7L2G1_9MAGN|nr:hypothetical protein GIB67_030090 [Kingdonia uniflora]
MNQTSTTTTEMPSSPKFFYPRQSSPSYTRRTLILVFSLVIGISGFVFGSISVLRSSNRCNNFQPRSVSVVWEKANGDGDGDGSSNRGVSSGDQKRHKVMGFVGIQTGFGSVGRRRSLRKTWMPFDQQGLQRISGFVFGTISVLRSSDRCNNFKPRSVSVVWERANGDDASNREDSGGDQKRHKVMGFVGIQTGFGSVGRRPFRKTWMPSATRTSAI